MGTFREFRDFLAGSTNYLCCVRHETGDDSCDPSWCPKQSKNTGCTHSLDPQLFAEFHRTSQPVKFGPYRPSWAAVAFLVAEFLNQQGIVVPRTIVEVDSDFPSLYDGLEDKAWEAYEPVSRQERSSYDDVELDLEVLREQRVLGKKAEQDYLHLIRTAFEHYWIEKIEPIQERTHRRSWNILNLLQERPKD